MAEELVRKLTLLQFMHDKMPCSALAHQRGITLITFACAVTIESTGAQKDTF